MPKKSKPAEPSAPDPAEQTAPLPTEEPTARGINLGMVGTVAQKLNDGPILQANQPPATQIGQTATAQQGPNKLLDIFRFPPIFLNVNPQISSLSPMGAMVGSGDLTLTVLGSNFGSGSTVTWNQSPRPTTVISNTQLTAAIGAVDLVTAGAPQVAVSNQGAAGTPPVVSTAVPFHVTPDISAIMAQLQAITAIPQDLMANLTTYISIQTSQVNGLNTQHNTDQSTIANLQSQLANQAATLAQQNTEIQTLTAQAQAAQSQSASPMDVAQSFKSVVDQIQQSALSAGGLQNTVTNMNIQLKSLVQVQGATASAPASATLVFPSPTALPDPAHLSTMNFSFGAIPSLKAAGVASSQPAAAPAAATTQPAAAPVPAQEPAARGMSRPESEVVTTVKESPVPLAGPGPAIGPMATASERAAAKRAPAKKSPAPKKQP